MKIFIFLALTLFLHGALGELLCEELSTGLCSFSIGSSGKRCLLETYASNDGTMDFQCKTSEGFAINLYEYIGADECCYQNCPNIVDLYYNLALGEGAFLPDLCKSQRINSHRSMVQIQSSGAALGHIPAAGPMSAFAPSPSSPVYCAPAPM
ncbi:unnamed protein product [Fraxinus pennsylvanica]|uniref:Uncharacterized protein n=1 Tax=Fraxinus pennsylvanica TaxID=56036 RepID=A0AAD2DM87_9LAMI|nr:unnamed protein product [Fraxinus pennsylvanica]